MRRSVRRVPAGPSSPWSDLDRPPLSAARLRAVVTGDGPWTSVDVVATTGSTNADLVAAARSGASAGRVLVAEEQVAGRGRLDRQWHAPARSGLTMSMLVRPAAPPSTWPLLPLLTGVAAVEALRAVARVVAVLKWPNDVLVDGRKLGGILVERVEDFAVIGIGINVSLRDDELPVPTATSVALAGGVADRESLAKELLRALGRRYVAWETAGGVPEAVVPAYREICATIGADVVVQQPGGGELVGTAREVDDTGALVVVDAEREHRISAGDVVHVRAGA
jgi:BirA family biotin operon repressor/biotin-[acetyl-CoA-carboxylase] ligase